MTLAGFGNNKGMSICSMSLSGLTVCFLSGGFAQKCCCTLNTTGYMKDFNLPAACKMCTGVYLWFFLGQDTVCSRGGYVLYTEPAYTPYYPFFT